MTTTLLHTKDLTKVYQISAGIFKGKQSLTAVNGISIDVNPGEVVGLVGESGCGKSTIARIVLGLEKATSGEVYYAGAPISDMDRKQRSRRIQPIFQDPYSSLNPRKSIETIVSLPYRVHKVGNRAAMMDRVDEILETVGLPSRMRYSYPNQLSGGQRQRVAIARALMMSPELVICDEPTSALDVSVQSQILNLLLDLRDQQGLTYLIITHNLSVVEHIATRVAVMYLGRIVEEAETKVLFSNPRHPYTHALLSSVLTPEPQMGLPKTHLGIAYPNPIDPPSGCTFHPRCPKVTEECKLSRPQASGPSGHFVECFHPEPE
ncbi:MAG: ATP-binding cassette domain-containing protein [Desulfobacula sp.]|jgi:peptide/nickel transport system ATP-binding protein|nr:ATP-binding cassette domain-containing protein [Desulfobacula sp.]MBT3485288.1 ATP-binding cassette domain-containing protein [Desulfobacula sp.]MBT3803652.1 ATP-binding cassette domain-containing protein [Desulfobacula sp.]MBT4024227.1 ATP-binding cassette domain-containing protein [Desulfobacula sp.]MBT4199297.1 ATP-binding cassette domain-containing protein [Desulfobacula sp.]